MIFEVVVGFVSVILVIWWLASPPARLRAMSAGVPGPRSYPLVGNALNFQIMGPNAFTAFREARNKYGTVFRLWLGPQLHYILFDPPDIQVLLSSTQHIAKSTVYEVLHEWIGTGLLVSTGELWHRRRKAITPTFHFKVLDDFVPVFNECGATLVGILKDKSDKDAFDITPYISNCALDTVSRSAMGVEVDAQINPKSSYVTSILQMTKLLGSKINYPWLAVEPFYSLSGQKKEEKRHLEILHSLPKQVLQEKRSRTDSKTADSNASDEFGIKRRCAFLELLLDMSEKKNPAFQSDKDIMDEVTTFMFEGHDTTTSGLTFTIWLLGKHPEIQENVYREVSSVISNEDDVKMEDLLQMKLLDRVIKESLRLYPPVPLIARKIEEDTVLPSGYILPAGCEVDFNIIVLHRDPRYFDNPDTFNPDRFLNELKHPYCYIPFSAGPRNCIGQKFAVTDMKAVLCKVILNYEILSEGELHVDHEMILRTLNGPFIKLSKRK